MTRQEMMTIVYNQLAIDYNCKPEDFYKDGVIFTIAGKQRVFGELRRIKDQVPNINDEILNVLNEL